MKNKRKYMIVFIWALVLYMMYQYGLLTFDIEHIQKLIEDNQRHAMALFVILFCIRIFLFIPGLPFIIMGGLIFGGIKGFFLSMIGMAVSSSFVYLLSVSFSKSKWIMKIKNKHNRLLPIMEKYNHTFLAVGILTPIANTDIICLLSTFTGIKYKRYLITVLLVNIPTVLLYSLIGNSYNSSVTGIITVAIFTVLKVTISLYILWKVKKNVELFKIDQNV